MTTGRKNTAASAPHEVLLVNLGTPTAPTPESVRDFLAEFLADRRVIGLPEWFWLPVLHGIILRTRPTKVAELYRSIWMEEGSPLDVGTRRMAETLGRELGPGYRVRYAYRYGTPNVAKLVAELASHDGPVTVMPLFPQRTGATSGTIEDVVARTVKKDRPRVSGTDPRIVIPASDDPFYVEALAARCEETFTRNAFRPEHLVVSFHGIPVRFDRGERGGYSASCRATTRALLERLGWDPARATLSFQSRFGPEPWLKPATDQTLATLPARGVKSVAVICPGFLTEGLETLEEIGVRGRESFLEAGGEACALVGAVEDHPAMIRCLATLLA